MSQKPGKTPSLEKASPAVTTACCKIVGSELSNKLETSSTYKMNMKPKEEKES
jgi:hypothetical protein